MARTFETNSYEPPPIGNHPARLISYVYLGKQESEQYGARKQCWLEFELVKVETDNNTPSKIGRFCTASMAKKAKLREIVESIVGQSLADAEARRLSVATLLGKACMLSVTHKDGENGVRAKVGNITSVPDGLEVPEAKSGITDYDCEEDGPEIPGTVPEFIVDIVKRSPQWKEAQARGPDPDDDIPWSVEGEQPKESEKSEPAF
jgi:hypothetical protein